MYEYSARLVRPVDADTWILHIDLGLRTWAHDVRIRAAGLNAPELSTPEGSAALRWVIGWFGQHCPDGILTVKTQKDRSDNYGRLLGTITAPNGACLNADLLATGHAEPWPRATAPA
ncbi:thermonuclease family protein [Streptomyces sp. NPDC093060]|uniref:thermonuclease family protein n=1 Tax=Streptomyces sp. NPDC093060 TaxID=3366019 RepID=UPI003827D853